MSLDKINSFKTFLVLGGGISGFASIELLKKKGKIVVLIDKKKPENLNSIDFFWEDENKLPDKPQIEAIVKSPGIYPDHPILKISQKMGIPVFSEVDLGYLFFSGKIIGITGTDGKSTTTALTAHILRSEWENTKACGNIGLPLTKICEENTPFLVCELSSYQLSDSNYVKTFISVILNIEKDHMDWHKNFENYKNAKLKIINNNDPNHLCITSEKIKNEFLSQFEHTIQMKTFGTSKNDDCRFDIDSQMIFTKNSSYSFRNFKLTGKHNLENLSIAILIAESVGVPTLKIQNALETFLGLPHRLEFVGKLNQTEFYNDSKSTNLNSLKTALLSFKNLENTILIVGGKIKDKEVFDFFKSYSFQKIYLIGEAIEIWEKDLRKIYSEKLVIKKTLLEVFQDFKNSKTLNNTNRVLLSPACASFDQYINFEERGNEFKALFQNLSREYDNLHQHYESLQ